MAAQTSWSTGSGTEPSRRAVAKSPAGKKRTPRTKAGKAAKIKTVLGEFKAGTLRSGSPTGPKVTDRAQGIAIALSEAGMSKKRSGGVLKSKG